MEKVKDKAICSLNEKLKHHHDYIGKMCKKLMEQDLRRSDEHTRYTVLEALHRAIDYMDSVVRSGNHNGAQLHQYFESIIKPLMVLPVDTFSLTAFLRFMEIKNLLIIEHLRGKQGVEGRRRHASLYNIPSRAF